jgi:hypothetical protein
MSRITLSCAIAMLLFPMASSAEDGTARLAQRKETWKKVLERDPFQFHEANVGVLYSLSQYGGDCEIHMIHYPKQPFRKTFKFIRDGKEILSLEGHTGSAFRTVGNTLYFAHVPLGTSGCTVSAHDLTTGKKLWETNLSAVGTPSHSKYSNEVTMGVATFFEHRKGEGAISITGRESFGDYIEILDRQTGQVLGHKIYRQGLENPK